MEHSALEQDLIRAVLAHEKIMVVMGEMRRARIRLLESALSLLVINKARVVRVESADGQPLTVQRIRDQVAGNERAGLNTGKVDRLFDALTTLKADERHIVLFVNDAHLLTADALTYLILLASSAQGVAPPLQIVFAGRQIIWEFLSRGGNLSPDTITTCLLTDETGEPDGVGDRAGSGSSSFKTLAAIGVPLAVIIIAGGGYWAMQRAGQPSQPVMVTQASAPSILASAAPPPVVVPAQPGVDVGPPKATDPPAPSPSAQPATVAAAAAPDTIAAAAAPDTTAPTDKANPPVIAEAIAERPQAAAIPATAGFTAEGDLVPQLTAAALPSTPTGVPAQPMTAPVMAALVKRGNSLLAAGDIAAARLVFGRAAAAGSGPAATGLAMTHDPRFLARIGARGIAADPKEAATWYKKAVALGDDSATAMIPGLGAPGAN